VQSNKHIYYVEAVVAVWAVYWDPV